MAQLPSIPSYFRDYVDSKVDLDIMRSIPCPFHGETKGKSFTYSPSLNKWRCWGACHCGGDVIDLHRLNYKLKSRSDAKLSLYALYGLTADVHSMLQERNVQPKESEVAERTLIAKALRMVTPDTWVDLDYIMSETPLDTEKLEVFVNEHDKQ